MTFVTQLWATAADLNDMSVPLEALASKTPQQKERALRAASGILATYLRGPYELPLAVTIEETSAEGFDTGDVAFEGAPAEAFAAMVRIAAGGEVGFDAITIERSLDGGETWEDAEPLPSSGRLSWSSVVFAFSGVVQAGAIAKLCAGVDWGIRQYVVDVGAYILVFNRGADPGSMHGQELSKRRDAAIAWGKDVQKRDAKLEEGSDATANVIEPRPRGGRRSSTGYLHWRQASRGRCGCG